MRRIVAFAHPHLLRLATIIVLATRSPKNTAIEPNKHSLDEEFLGRGLTGTRHTHEPCPFFVAFFPQTSTSTAVARASTKRNQSHPLLKPIQHTSGLVQPTVRTTDDVREALCNFSRREAPRQQTTTPRKGPHARKHANHTTTQAN